MAKRLKDPVGDGDNSDTSHSRKPESPLGLKGQEAGIVLP